MGHQPEAGVPVGLLLCSIIRCVDKMPELVVVILAALGFVAWLGGGKKWAFHTLLSALILLVLGVGSVLLYVFWTNKSAEHRTQKIHECAVAKVANPKCEEVPRSGAKIFQGQFMCPLYAISDNASTQQEDAAMVLAEQECRHEAGLEEKSLHEQISQYKREHGIKDQDENSTNKQRGPWDRYKEQACAAKVRKDYPGEYDDIDDATLTRKVLAKYPTYCDTKSATPGFTPIIEGIK